MARRISLRLHIAGDTAWHRRPALLESMPLEILYFIAGHSNIEDLVALRTVSKSLLDALSNRGIWVNLYRKSTFFLPPGPYNWQSTSYLVNTLLRAEKLHSVWPSPSSSPGARPNPSMDFPIMAALSVLLGRWLLVAVGPTLVCYDSQRTNIPESVKTLYDAGRRIFRLFSVGHVREDGILAFAVLVFRDSFTIARILMDRENPSSIQTILTFTPIVVEGWTDLVHVRLYHRLLMVNIGECSSDWESSGRLVVMDIDTLRLYHLLSSTDDVAFDPMRINSFFFATKTHLIKVTESYRTYDIVSKMECFPIPATHAVPESDVLCPSHQGRVMHNLLPRECTLIHESPIDLETGRLSFTLCGLNKSISHSDVLEIVEVCLEPDGSVSLATRKFALVMQVTSLCIGFSRQYAYGVVLRADGYAVTFALDYRGSGSFLFKYSMLGCKFPGLLASDAFGGTAFFTRRYRDRIRVEIVDFTRHARSVKGNLLGYTVRDGHTVESDGGC